MNDLHIFLKPSRIKVKYQSVRGYAIEAHQQVYRAVNAAMVEAYWKIGKEIYKPCGESERAAYGNCNPARERQVMLIIKLGLVPFYLSNSFFIICLMLLMLSLPPLVAVPVFFGVVGWLIMLPGSVLAICYALSMRKAGMISGGVAALFIVMQFFFVLDVVAALIMFLLGRSFEKAAKAGA